MNKNDSQGIVKPSLAKFDGNTTKVPTKVLLLWVFANLGVFIQRFRP